MATCVFMDLLYSMTAWRNIKWLSRQIPRLGAEHMPGNWAKTFTHGTDRGRICRAQL